MLKDSVCCAKGPMSGFTFSCTYRHDVTNSIIDIPEVGVQLPELAGNSALVSMTARTGVGKQLHALTSHQVSGEPLGFR